MERQTLFEYEALGASASLTHDREWLINFRTKGGSVLIQHWGCGEGSRAAAPTRYI